MVLVRAAVASSPLESGLPIVARRIDRGASLNKLHRDLRAAVLKRPEQSSGTVLRGRQIDIGLSGDKLGKSFLVSVRHSKQKGRFSFAINVVHICSSFNQEVDNFGVSVAGGHEKRGLSIGVGGIDVSALCDDLLCEIGTAESSDQGEGSASVLIRLVHVAAGHDELLSNVEVTVLKGPDEGGGAIL